MAMKASISGAINDALAPLSPPFGIHHFHHKFKNNALRFPSGDHPKHPFLLLASPKSNLSSSSLYIGELATGSDKNKSGRFSIRASEQQPEERSISPIAPVLLQTSAGKELMQVLEKDPLRFPQSLNQVLEFFQGEWDLLPGGLGPKFDKYSSDLDIWGTELEEIMYCLVIHTFLKNNIFKVQTISDGFTPYTRDDLQKLWLIHSPEILMMLSRYLFVVEAKHLVVPLESGLFELTYQQLASSYTASIIIGYYFGRLLTIVELITALQHDGKNLTWPQSLVLGESSLLSFPEDISYQVRRTIRSDKSWQKKMATIQSDHALSLMVKQTRAVFDRYDYTIVQRPSFELPADETILVTKETFTGLMLEAVAFGTFLLQSENYIKGCLMR